MTPLETTLLTLAIILLTDAVIGNTLYRRRLLAAETEAVFILTIFNQDLKRQGRKVVTMRDAQELESKGRMKEGDIVIDGTEWFRVEESDLSRGLAMARDRNPLGELDIVR